MDSEFEKRLSSQPVKQIPAEWRTEILAAVAADVNRRQAVSREFTFAATVGRRLREILWPSPVAWAGLAAAWMVILGLNLSMREKPAVLAEKTPPPSPEVLVELRQQHKLYAELIGIGETRDAGRQRVLSPKPRSERVEILAA